MIVVSINIGGGKNRFGAARVRTLTTFDREKQKEYHVPIVMQDSGKPKMKGTNILTITIGDKNDNPHFPGTKDIFVFNYKSKQKDKSTKLMFNILFNSLLVVLLSLR